MSERRYKVYVVERKGRNKAITKIAVWGEFIDPYTAYAQIEYNGQKDAYVVDERGNVIPFDET